MSVRNIIKEYVLVTTIVEPITFSGPYANPITVNVTFVKIGRSVTVTFPDVVAATIRASVISSSPIPESMYPNTQIILPYLAENGNGHNIAALTVYNNYIVFSYSASANTSFPISSLNLGFTAFCITYTSQN